MAAEDLSQVEFGQLMDLLRTHARRDPDKPALVDATRTISFAQLDALVDRVAAALQRDGVLKGDAVAISAPASIEYAAVFLGTLRAGGVVAPLAQSSTPESLAMMIRDSRSGLFFLDAAVGGELEAAGIAVEARLVTLDDSRHGASFAAWLAPEGAQPSPTPAEPDDAFNIIYSSGTTGAPKGIVQPHSMRWGQCVRGGVYTSRSVTIVSTPLCSNTTLISFLPALLSGGTVILMSKFNVGDFLALSEKHRVTHAMLVPVQYQRIMDFPDFNKFDLSSFEWKFATSAPFAADLKADIVARWPGALIEMYGMSEGGGATVLMAHLFPNKLHTVGRPMVGHDMRIINEEGRELPIGEIGELVGRSGMMMVGYHASPEKTSEAEWFSPEGLRYIRTGDVGRFDEDGFLTLLDRKKDMIISGGFNIYPSDLEAELLKHESVDEVAVVGVPSRDWGETPVAFVVLNPGTRTTENDLKTWLNARVGKVQRLSDVVAIDALPRSHMDKVLKRSLRETYIETQHQAAVR